MIVEIDLTSKVYPFITFLQEVVNIREWIDEMVEWDTNKYTIRFASKRTMIVWFEEDQHALFFKLRWA